MNRQDTFEHIAASLDDSSLICLSCTSKDIKLASSRAYESNYFWMLRVLSLTSQITLSSDEANYKRVYYDLLHALPYLSDALNAEIKYRRPGHTRELTCMQAWLSPTSSALLLQNDKVIEATPEQINYLFTLLSHIGATEPLRSLVTDPRVTRDTLTGSFENACEIGYTEVIRIILEADNLNISSSGAIQLFLDLCKRDELDIMWLFLGDERLATHIYTNEVFSCICKHGVADMVSLFLQDERIDPRTLNMECLKRIHDIGHSEVVHLLVQDGRTFIPTTDRDATSTEGQRESPSEAVIRYLSNPNLDPLRRYDRIFIDACSEGDWSIVECLLVGHEISDHLIGRGMIAASENGHEDRLTELISLLIK